MEIKPEGIVALTAGERELLRYGLVLLELALNSSEALFDVDAASNDGVQPSDSVRMLRLRAENPTQADGSLELQGSEPLLAWVAFRRVAQFEGPHAETSPGSAERFATATTLSSELGGRFGLPPNANRGE